MPEHMDHVAEVRDRWTGARLVARFYGEEGASRGAAFIKTLPNEERGRYDLVTWPDRERGRAGPDLPPW